MSFIHCLAIWSLIIILGPVLLIKISLVKNSMLHCSKFTRVVYSTSHIDVFKFLFIIVSCFLHQRPRF